MELAAVKDSISVLTKYREIRKETENLCLPLTPEDHVIQPVSDVSPPKWHLGHTTWFFEVFILKDHVRGYSLYNEKYPYLFNSYYESAGERIQRSDRGNLSRPSVEEVLEYRHVIDREMEKFLEEGLSPEVEQLVELGLNHEQQHQELLVTDIKYIFGNNPLFPSYHQHRWQEPDGYKVEKKWIPLEEGLYEVGYQGEGFSYDNESPAHKTYLNGCHIASTLVTNSDYLEFIEAGGYNDFSFWHDEGWAAVNSYGWKSPLYWVEKNGEWYEYTLSGLKPLNPDIPVTHISYFEASAYARWKGLRLPTEHEWEIFSRLTAQDYQKGNMLESRHYHPVKQYGTENLFGDCWEWTSSSYLPYPGYKQQEGALGEYNGKFMINQMVLRGGSCATPSSHIRNTYRNFFHTDKRWQFTGIRLAKD